MKYFIFSLATMICLLGCQTSTEGQETDEVSYSLGVVLGQNIKNQGLTELDLASLKKGLEDILTDQEPEISPDQCSQILNEYMSGQQAKQFEQVKADGEAFLAENGSRPEVKTTESGLQYEVITEGTGPKPTISDKVKVHYHGTLVDGTVFDSSVDKGIPSSFDLNILIEGWKEGLQMMNVGSKYKMYIPYNLAYGDRGSPPVIQPFSTIIFEVELLGIE